jgi:hypothetical protein
MEEEAMIADAIVYAAVAYWLWQRRHKVGETYRIWRKKRKQKSPA